MSQRLMSAMLRAELDASALAARVGVDVKTVNRWLAGRVPHKRTRIAVAEALGEPETTLWPQSRPDLSAGAPSTAEVVGAYAHRADIPTDLWGSLLLGAEEQIDQHPAIHLRRLSAHGMFASFTDQVEQIWATVTPYIGELVDG